MVVNLPAILNCSFLLLKKPCIFTCITMITFRILEVKESVLALDTSAHFCSNSDPYHLSTQQYNKIQPWLSSLATQQLDAESSSENFSVLQLTRPLHKAEYRGTEMKNTPIHFCFTDNRIIDFVNIHGVRCLSLESCHWTNTQPRVKGILQTKS